MQTSDKESPNTGDTNYFGIVFVAFLISVTAIVVVSVKMKKAKRILSLILCIAIAGSVLPNLQIHALEGNKDIEYSYINLSKYITVNNKPVPLPAVVSYVLDNTTDDNDEYEEIPEGGYTPKEENIVYTNKEKTYGYVNNMVFIFFNENLPEAERRAICESIDGKIIGSNKSLDLYDVEIPPRDKKGLQELCKQLEDMDGVITATYDIVGDTIAAVSSIPNDPWRDVFEGITGVTWDENNPDGLNWWLEATYVPSAWNYSQYFHHMKIGVADSGFDIGHEDLNITVLNESENTIDDHGTHVAGIIGATSNNERGIAGITRNADLLGYDVFPGSSIYTNLKEEMNGIDKLLEQGAKVINFSIYSKNNGLTQEEIYERGYEQAKYIAQFLHKFGPNFIIVTIAGNGNENDIGIDTKNANYFAGINDNIIDRVQQAYNEEFGTGEFFSKDEFYDSFMIVGAVDKKKTSDGEYQLTTFSNYGDAVTVCAPGQDVFSTIVTGGIDGSYGNMSGTSMAAPIVSGITSMVWAVNPDFTPSVVKDIVTSTATTKVNARNSGDPRDTYPMVNAKAAVEKAIQVSDDYNPNSDYGTIYGQVCEAETGNPLEATIEIYSSDELYQTITSSAETGDFSVSLPAGTYELKFSKDGYKVEKYFDEYAITVPLEEGGLYILSDPIEMTKMPFVISGKVVDRDTQNPIEGVEVSLNGVDEDAQEIIITSSVTQENGTFSLTVPEDNTATITGIDFKKDGYSDYRFPISALHNESFDIGTVFLSPSSSTSIFGKVVDSETQSSLDGVEVSLNGIDENENEIVVSTATTSTDGKFNLDVPSGNTAKLTSISFKKDRYEDYLYSLESFDNESMDIGTIYLKLSESIGDITGDIIYISTPKQFNDIRKNLDAHYVLLNDIDLSDFTFWAPIGTSTNPFTGILDGNGYNITGFTISGSSTGFDLSEEIDSKGHTEYCGAAIFGTVSDGAKIKNLNVKNASISCDSSYSTTCHAVLVGKLFGSESAKTTLENCSVSGNMTINSTGGYIGGIVGYSNEYAEIINCQNYCDIDTYVQLSDCLQLYAGGILGGGWGSYPNIEHCYNEGNIEALIDVIDHSWAAEMAVDGLLKQSTGVGGIAGNSINIKNCCNVATRLQLQSDVPVGQCGRIASTYDTRHQNCVSFKYTIVNGQFVTSTDPTSIHGKDMDTVEEVEDWYNSFN